MSILRLLTAVSITASLAMTLQAEQTPAPGGAPAQGGGRAAGAGRGGAPIGGTLTPAKADARGWGWQVKASINPATPRPFYNKAKELLFQDRQITSHTISSYNPDAATTSRSPKRSRLSACRNRLPSYPAPQCVISYTR